MRKQHGYGYNIYLPALLSSLRTDIPGNENHGVVFSNTKYLTEEVDNEYYRFPINLILIPRFLITLISIPRY